MRLKHLLLCASFVLALPGTAQIEDVEHEDSLQEVIVNAHSARKRMNEVQMGVEKIEITTLAKVPVLFGEKDIIKSLQLLPGVKSDGETSGGYQVRGGKATQNLILLDGASIYNSGHLMGIFSSFNDDALINATLYKGMMPADLGGATSSVFDISTRPGNMQEYHASGSIGLLAAKAMVEGPIKKDRASFFVAARRSYVDLLLKASKDFKNNTLNFYDLNARLDYKLNDKHRLALTFFHSRDNMGLEDMMSLKWNNTAVGLNWFHAASDRYFAKTRLTYSNYGSDATIDMMSTHYSMTGFIRHLTLHREDHLTLGSHKLNLGLESTLLHLQSAEWDINLLHQREHRKAWTNAFWVNDDWKTGRLLDVSAGVRLRLFSVLGGVPYYQLDDDGNITETLTTTGGEFVKTYIHPEPRLSMKLQLGAKHSLKLGYSRTTQDIRAISSTTQSMPIDRYTMTSNILLPEIADQVALGWTGMTTDGTYDFSAETYYKHINNTYDYRDGKSFYSEIEIERLLLGGRGRAYGLELCARKNKGRLTGWMSYTLSWSENKIPGINGGKWYTAPNDRRHDLNIVSMFRLTKHWDLTATWRYTTGQAMSAPSAKYEIDGTTYYYYAERNGYRAPAYHRLDLSASHTKRIGKRKRLTRIWTLGVYNAYNRYNPFSISFVNDMDKPTGTKAEQTSIYGILPSVSFTLKY